MFERTPVDNFSVHTVLVEISLDDGTARIGRAALEQGRSVHALLNGSGPFLYVESLDGDADFLPKARIAALKLVKPIEPRVLNQPSLDASRFDPARVLGVSSTAPWSEVHAAYRDLVKLYHPDRFASVDLPPEVAAYLDAKAKQITLAFRLLKSARNGAVT
ncbi:MAG: DnaJ family molecular chaperone [Hyphomicrobiaceae bacterium]